MEEVEAFVLVLEDSAEEVEASTASGGTVASMEAGIFREIHEWKLPWKCQWKLPWKLPRNRIISIGFHELPLIVVCFHNLCTTFR